MRKTSLLQRFPVSDWLSGLRTLYSRVIEHSDDTVLKTLADSDAHPEQGSPLPKSRELLIRSGLPELSYSKGIKVLQEKIELFEAQQSREMLVPTCDAKDEIIEKHEESNHSTITSSTAEAIINAIIVEETCDFKLLPLGEISPFMIGSLHFKNTSSYGSVSNKNVSEVSISALFDSVSLDVIRKNTVYSVKTFEQFSDEDGLVTAQYELDLAKLDSHNSIRDLCIAERIRTAERGYFWNLR
jgi:hypothetical protein